MRCRKIPLMIILIRKWSLTMSCLPEHVWPDRITAAWWKQLCQLKLCLCNRCTVSMCLTENLHLVSTAVFFWAYSWQTWSQTGCWKHSTLSYCSIQCMNICLFHVNSVSSVTRLVSHSSETLISSVLLLFSSVEKARTGWFSLGSLSSYCPKWNSVRKLLN